MSKLTTNCPACSGSGRVPLAQQYADTLALFRNGKQLSSLQVVDKLADSDVERTAVFQRLTRLVRMGFLSFTEQPGRKGRLYFRK